MLSAGTWVEVGCLLWVPVVDALVAVGDPLPSLWTAPRVVFLSGFICAQPCLYVLNGGGGAGDERWLDV